METFTALATLENHTSSTEVQPVGKDTFLLTPPSLGFYTSAPIYVMGKENTLFISEEPISPENLLGDVFDENSKTSHAPIYSFNPDELEDLIDEDPLLLADFYQLISTHDNLEEDMILDLINLLSSKDFSSVAVIHRLMAASTSEVEKILNSANPISEYLNLIK